MGIVLVVSVVVIVVGIGVLITISNTQHERAQQIVLDAKKLWFARGGDEYIGRKNNYTHKCSLSVAKSAEGKPKDYIYKYFYKDASPEEKQKLLTFAREANRDFKNSYLMLKAERDKIIDELGLNSITILGKSLRDIISYPYWHIDERKAYFVFSYASPQGRSSKVVRILATPEIADFLEGKDGIKESAKRERNLMNDKLREKILQRDHYTCQYCGISKKQEPHLLLEVDHIIPVSKGGKTVESNLQTLCWKCNRSKGNKV